MKNVTFKTRHALVLSCISLMTCFAMLLGTTFAWFTDSVTSGVNRIVAGNLDVEVYHKTSGTGTANPEEKVDGTTKLFTKDINGKDLLWEPEVIAYESFDVRNVGSLALKYALQLNNVGYNYVDGTGKWLGEVIKVAIADTAPADRAAAQALFSTTSPTLATFVSSAADFTSLTNADGKLEPAAANADPAYTSEKFTVVLYWPQSSADNSWNLGNINGTEVKSSDGNPLYVNLGITLVATQVESEFDSFSNTYDASADTADVEDKWAGVAVASAAPTLTATTDVNNVTTTTATTTVAAAPTTDTSKQTTVTLTAVSSDSHAAFNQNSKLNLKVETNDVKASSSSTAFTVSDGSTAVASIDLTLTKITTTTSGSETSTHEDELHSGFTAQIETYIAKNLSDVTITYKNDDGTPETWTADNTDDAHKLTYDAESGKLTFTTTHFSQYIVTSERAVAYIAATDKTYTTLRNALNEVNDNQTITLLKNDTWNTRYTIDNGKTFTIDLAGNKLIGSYDQDKKDQHLLDIKSGFVTIKNGTIDYAGYQGLNVFPSDDSANDAGSYNSLTVNDVTVNANYAIILRNNGTKDYGSKIDINNAALNGNIWVIGTSAEGNSIINVNKGTTVKAANTDEDGVGIAVQGCSIVNVAEGVTVTGKTGIEIAGGTLNIYGGKITGTGDSMSETVTFNGTTISGAGIAVSPYGICDITLNMNAGDVSGLKAVYYKNVRKVTVHTDPTYNITGGTFNTNPSAYCADGYTGAKEGNVYKIVKAWDGKPSYGLLNNGKYTVTAADVEHIPHSGEVYTVGTEADFATMLYFAANGPEVLKAQSSGNYTVNLTADLNLAGKWIAHAIDGYHGTNIVTINGNNHTISGLNQSIVASGFAGDCGVLFNDITVSDSKVVAFTDQGNGAFISTTDSMEIVKLNNCKVVDSEITGGERGGALVGWTSGYDNTNDGPVKSKVIILNCEVNNTTVEAIKSAAGIIGHEGANAWTFHRIENCSVTNSTFSGKYPGEIIGTANCGQVLGTGITLTNNTINDTDGTGDTALYFGRYAFNNVGYVKVAGTHNGEAYTVESGSYNPLNKTVFIGF